MKRIFGCLLAVILMAGLTSPIAQAEQPKNKGLFITPLREYIDVKTGGVKNAQLAVANLTDKPATVTMSAQQFSVADYTYDYEFSPPKEDWIRFGSSQFTLQPGKSQTVPYTIAVSKNAPPGGHYFALFATTKVGNGIVDSNVRVATVLYVTVDGNLKRTSQLEKAQLPWISFGGDLPFQFDARSTGNTHFFIYPFGKLEGLWGRWEHKETAHILLPASVRTIKGTIPPPLLPGIYKATYGYRTDDNTVIRSQYVIYAPLWFFLVLAGGIWLVVLFIKSYRKISKRATDSSRQPHT